MLAVGSIQEAQKKGLTAHLASGGGPPDLWRIATNKVRDAPEFNAPRVEFQQSVIGMRRALCEEHAKITFFRRALMLLQLALCERVYGEKKLRFNFCVGL